MDGCDYIVENASAAALAQQVRTLAAGAAHARAPARIRIGSPQFVAGGGPEQGETVSVWRLANLAFALRADDGAAVTDALQHAASRHARNSTWALTPRGAPRIVQHFGFDSPQQSVLAAALVLRVLGHAAGTLAWVDLDSGAASSAHAAPAAGATAHADHSPMRHLSLDVVGPRVLRHAAAPYLGLIGQPAADLDAPTPSCAATLRFEGMPDIITLGRARTYRQAAYVAALEACERHAGLSGAHYASSWKARYRDIDEAKLDPRSTGLHLASSHATPGFGYAAFDDDLELDWVRARDLTTGAGIAVPACMAYYGGTPGMPARRLAYDTSNGCAIGTSLEEASLHALLELIERDAFLLAWYRSRSLPDITAALARQPVLRWTIAKLELLTGMRVKILDSSAEHGIPSVICVALGDGFPATALAAGCAFSHADAALSALAELSGHCLFLKQRAADPAVVERARAMFADPLLVSSMEDHGYLNALPESRERIAGLLGRAAELPPAAPAAEQPRSVRASLEWVLARLRAAGLRAIAVEQRVPSLEGPGLKCVKMICPGLLPMTFGHVNRRPTLARIGDAAALAAAAARPPHPFM